MKNILLTFFIGFAGINMLFSQDISNLETGPLLFIQPTEACTVYLDGDELGESPLLISDISMDNNTLQLLGEHSFVETEIRFNPEMSDVCYYSPSLENYYGYLSISTNQKNTDLFIDNIPYDYTPGEQIRLKTGKHVVRMEDDCCFPKEEVVEIPKLDKVEVVFNLPRAVKININRQFLFLENTTISFVSEETGEVVLYSEQDEILLYSGEWKGYITNQLFSDVEFLVIVEEEPVDIILDLHFFQPQIKLVGLQKGSSVFLSDEDVTDQIADMTLPVPVGKNRISILRDNYLPITNDFLVEGDQILDINLEYESDPAYEKGKRLTTGIVLLASGLSILATGLILNNDNVILDRMPDYESYRTMKYATLGAGGAGLAMAITGAVFSFTAIGD